MTYTTTDILITVPEPTKKEIIERLFLAGHITFNEMWTLLQDKEPEVKYIPMPQPQDFYPIPYWTPPNPETTGQ